MHTNARLRTHVLAHAWALGSQMFEQWAAPLRGRTWENGLFSFFALKEQIRHSAPCSTSTDTSPVISLTTQCTHTHSHRRTLTHTQICITSPLRTCAHSLSRKLPNSEWHKESIKTQMFWQRKRKPLGILHCLADGNYTIKDITIQYKCCQIIIVKQEKLAHSKQQHTAEKQMKQMISQRSKRAVFRSLELYMPQIRERSSQQLIFSLF